MNLFKNISLKISIIILLIISLLPLNNIYAFTGGDADNGGTVVIRSTGPCIVDSTDGEFVTGTNDNGTWTGRHSIAVWNDEKQTVYYAMRAEILSGNTEACASNHNGQLWHHYAGHTTLMVENPDYDSTKAISNSNLKFLPMPKINSEDYYIFQKKLANGEAQYQTASYTIDFSSIDLTQYILKNRSFDATSNFSTIISDENRKENSIGSVFANAYADDGQVKLAIFAFLDEVLGYTRNSVANSLTRYEKETGYTDTTDVAYHNVWIKDPIVSYKWSIDDNSTEYKVVSGNEYDVNKDVDKDPTTFDETVTKDQIGKYYHITFYTKSGDSRNTTILIPGGALVTYDLNGGTGTTPNPQYVTKDDSIVIRDINEDTSYNYYKFVGWSKEKKDILEADANLGDDIYKPGYTHSFTEDTTLYAVWQKELVTVKLNITLNDIENNTFTTITGKIGNKDYKSVDDLVNFEKGSDIELHIKGDEDTYYISEDNPDKLNNCEIVISDKILEDREYDIPFGTIHTIKYDTNGGTINPIPKDQKKYFGTVISIIGDKPTRPGYEFSKWKSSATEDLYSPKQIYKYDQKGGTIVMLAQWTPITYSITFDKNKPNDASTDVKYTMNDMTLTFDKIANLNPNKYKLAGWVFQGWNTKADGTGDAYSDKAEVINLTTEKNKIITLYAQWKNIDSQNIPPKDEDDKTNYHNLKLMLNNNGTLYNVNEEIKEILELDGEILQADNPDFKYPNITDISFKESKNTNKNTTVYLNDKNQYSFYKLKAGDSYIETQDNNNKILHKFVGWSVYKYATKSQSPQVIHPELSVDNMLNLIYEYQAINQLGYNEEEQPVNAALSGKADSILSKKTALLDKAEDISDRNIMVYAVWDEYPLMKVEDIGIMSENFKNITDESMLEEVLLKAIYNSIVTDREDGNWDKGSNRDIEVRMDPVSLTNAYYFLQDRYKALIDGNDIYSSTGASSINVTVTDKTGNTTVQIINVWIVAQNPILKNKDDVTPDNSVFKPVTSYVRGITREFYQQDQENGGLIEYSQWKINPEYKNELIKTFDILEKDTGYDQVWKFTRKDVKEVQEYIQTNGLGNSDNLNALRDFYDTFKDKCKIQ